MLSLSWKIHKELFGSENPVIGDSLEVAGIPCEVRRIDKDGVYYELADIEVQSPQEEEAED
jgi:hypothetical protein